MKIVLIGGHLTPLLAVLDELEKNRDNKITVIARKYSTEGSKAKSLETTIFQNRRVVVEYLTTGRLQRHISLQTLPSLFKLPIGLLRAFVLLQEIKPDVVVSFGGYLSLPVMTAAWLLHMPTVVHEQSVRAGLANRLMSRLATRNLLSWESSRPFFPKQTSVVIGNPIRQLLSEAEAADSDLTEFLAFEPNRPLIYITGGNQGSHVINQAVFAIVPKLLEKYKIFHQIGNANAPDVEQAEEIRKNLPDHLHMAYVTAPYIANPANLGAIFHAANLIVGRSGANTVTEVAALGKPALFIPLPFAQQNEQEENAKMLVNTGIAEILPQAELSGHALFLKITDMLANRSRYTKNADRAKALVHPDAAQIIAAEIIAAARTS